MHVDVARDRAGDGATAGELRGAEDRVWARAAAATFQRWRTGASTIGSTKYLVYTRWLCFIRPWCRLFFQRERCVTGGSENGTRGLGVGKKAPPHGLQDSPRAISGKHVYQLGTAP